MVSPRFWVCFAVSFAHILAKGSALMCYVCGQNNLLEPGECATQFQYNCTSFAQAKGLSEETKLFCRTMRHKTENHTFNVYKECTTELDHRQIFPDGKLFGCDSLFDSTGLEVSYCICDWNMCNKQPLHEQLQNLEQILPRRPTLVAPRLPQPANISVGANVKLAGPPVPLPDSVLVSHTQPLSGALALPPVEHSASLENPSVVELVTAPALGPEIQRVNLGVRTTAGSVGGLVCMICGEGNLPGPDPECRKQHAMDCSTQYPSGVKTYCFSRDTKLSNGMHAIEKLCLSGESLRQEYGDAVVMSGCASSWQGRVEYCVCNTSKCNEKTMKTQIALSPPASASTKSASVAGGTVKGSQKCFVCGEQNMSVPTDCSQMYQYDCNIQYPTDTEVLCLTRQTVLSTGLYAIEKRCISATEHKQQYPDADVIMDGCGQAWNNYVEYCVCVGDFCNHKNLTVQKQAYILQKAEIQDTGVTEVSVMPDPIPYYPPEPEGTETPSTTSGTSFEFLDEQNELTQADDSSSVTEGELGDDVIIETQNIPEIEVQENSLFTTETDRHKFRANSETAEAEISGIDRLSINFLFVIGSNVLLIFAAL